MPFCALSSPKGTVVNMKKRFYVLIGILFLFCLGIIFQQDKEIPMEVYKNITQEEYYVALIKSKAQHDILIADGDKYVQVNVKRNLDSIDVPVDFIVSYIIRETGNDKTILKDSIVVEVKNPIIHRNDYYNFKVMDIYSNEEDGAVAFVMARFHIVEKNGLTERKENIMLDNEMIKYRCKQA